MKKRELKTSKENKSGVIKYVNEDTNEIRKFILILGCVALIAVILYFVTAKYLVKDRFQEKTNTIVEETISYDTVKGGSLFNRPYDEYYVLAYEKDNTDASYYAALVNNYSGDIKIYTMDLSLETNKQYTGEKGNSSATNASELSLVSPTLIFIKDGKISKYYEGKDDITDALK